ncbi:putative MFS family arabinose efflux permease [Janthinobacterium sp. 61]|uniref:MFS transporter n=1 Tax=Janthinobacterium sp. 61 TaxID=2035209 RepID=UPI000CBDAECD|nr:MFS transporter [Janthinobacterium sp. 61]PKV46033.1 putative MFS family arabinose efflux permease [Janthinobacterium sp. 61]
MHGADASSRSGVAVFCLVFLPFALGHYLSCLLRGVNAVLTAELLASVALTPAQLGLLTSVFFLAFALVQLPIGMALDRYGPRTVQLGLLALAALGVWLFSRGHSFAELILARAVMGAGLGGCFMAAVKAISCAIAPSRLPSVHGYLIAVGGLGAATATMPVKLALHYTDWRGVFLGLALAALAIGVLIRLLSPAMPGRAPTHTVSKVSAWNVYRDVAFRRTIALILLPHAVFFGVQGLWIGRWLADVGGLSDDSVAYLLYLGMASVIFGAIGMGMLTEWAGRRAIEPMQVAAAGLVLFVAVQVTMACNVVPSLPLLSVLFSLLGTVTGLEYAIVAQSMPSSLTGRAATCLNLLIFTGAFLVQAGFGLILGCWPLNSLQQYPPQAYQVAFGVLAALQLPGLAMFFIRRYRRAGPSGKMAACTAAMINSKEDYETRSLWTSRQGKTGPDR